MVRFMQCKSERADAVISIITELGKNFTSKIVLLCCTDRNTIRWMKSDGGEKYVEESFQKWLKERAIVHEVTAGYSPEFNGRA